MPPSCIKSRAFLWLFGLLALGVGLCVPACGGGAGVGESCGSVSDCASSLQCLDHTCVPRCTRNSDCGDGHFCRPDGICELSPKEQGERCVSEYDCMPGLSCQLAGEDIDGDGLLTASCEPENPGGVLDDACRGLDQAAADAECRTGTCVLGRCVDVCVPDPENLDCPETHTCALIPRELEGPGDPNASFHGCLPALGNIVYDLPISQTYSHFLLPVPDNARSVALVAEIDDSTQLVGAAYLKSPSGEEPFTLASTRAGYFANAVRSDIAHGAWALVLPQTPDVPLEAGAYTVELGSYLDRDHNPGTEVPRVRAIYKLEDDARDLELHFYFLDLADHPCTGDVDLPTTLDAATAQESGRFLSDFVDDLKTTFAVAGILLDENALTYTDITDRPDLDHLDTGKLGDLLSLSTADGGVSVFFVRTIAPAGVAALVGGPPSPPGLAGTRASGVAISIDTLCYRDWHQLARTTAHEIARSLGLMRSVEPDGYTDPIADSDFERSNLMYFSENGGALLSEDQKVILRSSPALR